jgi:hypothetical protein
LVLTVAVICKEQLRSYEQDFAIEDNDPTVISVVAMHYGHTNIANDAMDGSVGQDDGQLLPGMEICVRFKDLEASVYVF